MASDFIHLHVHSHYSLLDGAAKVDRLVERAVDEQMPACALTDHGVMIGAVEFYQKCKANGVKPIIGMEAYLTTGSRHDRRPVKQGGSPTYHITLLARDNDGYRNLMKLSSIGFLEGFYYRPRVDLETLRAHAKGVTALSGCPSGEIPKLIVKGDIDGAEAVARRNLEIFGEDGFFLEVMRHGIDDEKTIVEGLVEVHKRTGIPLVCTADVHYVRPDDAEAQEVLMCINTQKTLDDPTRIQLQDYPLYFRPGSEMKDLFVDLPGAVESTLRVAESCNVDLDFSSHHLPRFDPPDGLSDDDYLRKLVVDGAKARYGSPLSDKVTKRIDYELGVIRKMGFSSYFLITWDFIHFAQTQSIPVGPGRGSAAGSIVAYSLGITALDPLEYDLIFERFLNPSRISMPDIDIDFCTDGRERVIDYVRDKYGDDRVASIITIGTLAARAVIRDVGRVLRVPLPEVDQICKKIPGTPGMSLDTAFAQDKELAGLKEATPVHRRLFDISERLEGVARHAGTHAAGIVIADKPLAEYVPLYKRGDEVSTQYTMDKLEDIGLLKVDFLGLKTLTLIDRALAEIARRHGERPSMETLPLDDAKTYELLAAGRAGGVFQVESEGMRDILVRLVPDRFEDLIAILALYRPGPLQSGMVDTYINRKHGREEVAYLHPELEPILDETYGVILYQEQVMRIANVLAGFSMADADSLRKAMGKKKPEVMKKFKSKFIDGGAERGIDGALMDEIFTQIEYFAGYGFNKSHSAAYALITYQTAWLKANHPLEFAAALLTQDMANTDKLIAYKRQAEESGIEVLTPSVNASQWAFTVEGGAIRFGLGGIKGVGDKAIESVVKAREERGRFDSLFAVTESCDVRAVNKTALEALIKAGALDELGPRGALLAAVDEALGHGGRVAKDLMAGQSGLFDDGEADLPPPKLPDVPDLDEKTRLAGEKASLGFYLSGHPLEEHKEAIATYGTCTVDKLERKEDGAEIYVGGLFSSIALRIIKNGRRAGEKMASCQFADLTGEAPAVLFPDAYQAHASMLLEDMPVVIKAKVDRRRDVPQLMVDRVVPLEGAVDAFGARTLEIRLSRDRQTDEVLERVRDKLIDFPGGAPVRFVIAGASSERPRVVVAGDQYKVRPGDAQLIHELELLVGEGMVVRA